MSKVHDLKTWTIYFIPVWIGDKTFEFRYDDRGFDVGDLLRLHEWDNDAEKFTGRLIEATVPYMLSKGSMQPFELDPNYVIMALDVTQKCFRGGGDYRLPKGSGCMSGEGWK